jgi:hypothetical protein
MLHPYKIILMILLLSAGSFSLKESLAAGTAVEKKAFAEVLNKLGTDYDRFFTIEEVKSAGEMGALSVRQVARPGKKLGLNRELEELRRKIAGFEYFTDTRNPQVIHIVDARLLVQKHYAMSLTVKELNFNGPLFQLPYNLKQHGIPVELSRVYSTTTFMTADFRMQVSVKAKSIKVREALTDLNSLKGRSSRVIWTSETTIGKNQDSVIVFYI